MLTKKTGGQDIANFFENIKMLRGEWGLSLWRLSRKTGVPVYHLLALEHNIMFERFTVEHLLRLSCFFRVPPAVLYMLNESKDFKSHLFYKRPEDTIEKRQKGSLTQ